VRGNEVVSLWTGLPHRPSWYHRCLVRDAVVLIGCAICVPFRARPHRFATVNHGHLRSSDLQAPYLQVRGNTNGKNEVAPLVAEVAAKVQRPSRAGGACEVLLRRFLCVKDPRR
jgi:hypothetical protein